MRIRDQVEKLKEKIQDAQIEVQNLQNQCPHRISVYSAHGSSGNWDRDDSYWYNFHCYDCDKRWSHEQSMGHGSSLKLDNINTKEDPRIIEIRIENRDHEHH